MNILVKHILRNIKTHLGATILMIFSLGLAAAVVFLCLNISGDLLQVSESSLKSLYGGYNYIAYTTDTDFVFNKDDFVGYDIKLAIAASDIPDDAGSVIKEKRTICLVKSGKNQEFFESDFHRQYPFMKLEQIDSRVNVKSQLDSMKYILGIMVVVTIAMGFFVIRSVTVQLLDERKSVIATFRSVGATQIQTSKILIAENVVYGLLGGLLGLLMGQVLRSIITHRYYHDLSVVLKQRFLFILIELSFSVVLQLAITLSALIKSSGLSVRESLFVKPETEYKISLKRSFYGLGLILISVIVWMINRKYNLFINSFVLMAVVTGVYLFLPFVIKILSECISKVCLRNNHGHMFLSWRNLFADRNNVGSITLCCMLMSLMIVVSGCVKSVDSYFENYKKNYPFDIFVKGVELDASEYNFFKFIPGVGEVIVEYWDYDWWNVNGKNTKLCMVKQKGYSGIITVDKEAEENLQKGRVIIDSVFAGEYNIKAGDFIELVREGSGEGFTVQVDGFCDSGFFNSGRKTILLSDADYFEFIERSPALLGMRVWQGDPQYVKSTLEDYVRRETGESVSIKIASEYVERELSNVNAALSALSILPICVVAMALVGMFNNQILSFNSKRRQYATFCSFGVKRKTLKKILITETIEIYIIGSLVGIGVGVLLLRIFRDIVYQVVAYIPIKVDYKMVFGFAAIGLVTLICASFPVIRRIDKMEVSEEIKYE